MIAQKIYLDVCCLSRPLDDQTQAKVRLESQVISQILKLCARGRITLCWSEMIDFEVGRIPDFQKREKISTLSVLAETNVILDEELRNRAKELQEVLGVKAQDAFHLACSEKCESDIFLTTDEQLLKKIKKNAKMVKVDAANPVEWFIRVV